MKFLVLAMSLCLLSPTVLADTFEQYLGEYSIASATCYENGIPFESNCAPEKLIISLEDGKPCLQKVEAHGSPIKQCLFARSSQSDIDHGPRHFMESHFETHFPGYARWTQNRVFGRYAYSQSYSVRQQSEDNLLFHESTTEITGENSKSVVRFFVMKK